MKRLYAAALVAILILAPVYAAAQTNANTKATKDAKNTKALPRMPWGHPDLQGVWDYRSITPLQRPAQYGDRAFLTEEEARNLEQSAEDLDASSDAAPARPAKAGENVGAYNRFWLDFGTRTVNDRRTSLITDPPTGRFPEMTAAGAAEAKLRMPFGADLPISSYEDLGLGDRCRNTRGVPILPGAYNNNVHVFQTQDYVAINVEWFHIWRIIPLDGRPHGAIRQWVGDSRGHWEGDTLVVETTNFQGLVSNIGSGRGIRKLVERFTRVSPEAVRYEFTVDDPVRFVRPWSAALTLWQSDGKVYEFACHEGNYAIVNILNGALAPDAKPAADAKPGALCIDCEARENVAR